MMSEIQLTVINNQVDGIFLNFKYDFYLEKDQKI